MDRCSRRLDYSGAKMRLSLLLKKKKADYSCYQMLLNGIVLFDQENDFSAMKLKEHEFRAITQSLRYYSKCIRTVHAGHSAFDVFAPAHETRRSRLTGQKLCICKPLLLCKPLWLRKRQLLCKP